MGAHVMPQRSPIIFWLLLAATLCVDAVLFTWMTAEPYRTSVYVNVAFRALILGQLSIVCIWSAFSSVTWAMSYIAPIVAVLACTFLTIVDPDPDTPRAFNIYLGYYGFHAALLLATLWVLQRSSVWRRRDSGLRQWRYSVAQLLIWMTAVAILVAAMRENPFFQQFKSSTIAAGCSFVALSLGSVLIWSLAWHWLLRLAAVLGLAIVLGIILSATTDLTARFTYASYLIQGVVLSIWLGATQVLPATLASAVPADVARSSAKQ